MSTYINDLHLYGLEVIVSKEDKIYHVDVKSTKAGKYEVGEYIAGFTDLKTEDEAEFLARAWIDGFKQGIKT